MGSLALAGRDKLTLITSPKVSTFGYWIEQLVAESTGKHGRGIVPVEGEPVGVPAVYGADRLFVHTRMAADKDNAEVAAIERSGQPVVTLTWRDRLDLGGEFFRWEIATAVAGSLLGIDAFDQPNVQESKDHTHANLDRLVDTGHMDQPAGVPALEAGPAIVDMVRSAPEGAYFAIMSYTGRDSASEKALSRIRAAVRDHTRIATTAGYGPRFLHSTGQLHKGGPAKGVFLQVVQDDTVDVAIPGKAYGFKSLKAAQALGDWTSLESRKLRALRVNLGPDPLAGWKALADGVERAFR